jgi:Fur family zinc uptake transcriptional regulator
VSTDKAIIDWRQLESRAAAALEAVGKAMTDQRRAVLLAIWTANSVVTLETMSAALEAHRAASRSSVARALVDFRDARILQRVETRRGYILAPTKPSILLVCANCSFVGMVEMEAVNAELGAVALSRGFKIGFSAIEVVGCCEPCVGDPNRN